MLYYYLWKASDDRRRPLARCRRRPRSRRRRGPPSPAAKSSPSPLRVAARSTCRAHIRRLACYITTYGRLPMTGGGALTFRDVSKTYADGTRAVEGLNLRVSAGELMVLVGPSGCGKTSALRMVAGLEEIPAGTILLDDRELNHVAPERRGIAMVFQSYALFPHLNAYDNIAFGLKVRRTSKAEIEERVRAVAQPLGLDGMLAKKPKHLSGGQRRRVAMGRAIVRDPMVLLMDEPLSNLDAKLRVEMRTEISRIQ